MALASERFGTPRSRVRRVDSGTLNQRAASCIVTISLFLIAWTASKIQPSCSTELRPDMDRSGGMVVVKKVSYDMETKI